MKTLATCSAAVCGLWAVLYAVPAPVPPATAWYDKAIVYEIGVVFCTAAIVMLISRRMWTIRAIGLFFSALAIGVLFANAAYIRYVGYTVRNGRIVPDTDPGVQEAISDAARALLIIGGPLLMIGLIGWLYGRYGPQHDDLLPTPDRRHTVRRESDRQMLARLEYLEREHGGGAS